MSYDKMDLQTAAQNFELGNLTVNANGLKVFVTYGPDSYKAELLADRLTEEGLKVSVQRYGSGNGFKAQGTPGLAKHEQTSGVDWLMIFPRDGQTWEAAN